MAEPVLIRYVDRKFSEATLKLIAQASQIIDSYEKRGMAMSLRQLYYRFVTEKILPNVKESYSKLGSAVNQGRLAGLLSWTAIEDRGRALMGLQHMSHPRQALSAARADYRRDLWEGQRYRPEVWIEKAALTGVIDSICNAQRVDFFACRGYNSQSEQWRAGQRFQDYVERGQQPVVFHLGDHDPSGLDMTEDNQRRLNMFTGTPVMVVRLALNMDQIEKYKLAPDPAKIDDSRAKAYIEKYGPSSWELDALDPAVLQDIISEAVNKIRDPIVWEQQLQRENSDLRRLDEMLEDLL